MELQEKIQLEALADAIGKYYVSPGLLKKVVEFAEEQGAVFMKFDGTTGLFHFSNGEPYTGEAILQHFGIDAPETLYEKG